MPTHRMDQHASSRDQGTRAQGPQDPAQDQDQKDQDPSEDPETRARDRAGTAKPGAPPTTRRQAARRSRALRRPASNPTSSVRRTPGQCAGHGGSRPESGGLALVPARNPCQLRKKASSTPAAEKRRGDDEVKGSNAWGHRKMTADKHRGEARPMPRTHALAGHMPLAQRALTCPMCRAVDAAPSTCQRQSELSERGPLPCPWPGEDRRRWKLATPAVEGMRCTKPWCQCGLGCDGRACHRYR